MNEVHLAAELYRVMFGEDPPAPDVPWDQWQVDVHDNDGTKPLYALDRDAGQISIYLHEGQRRVWGSEARFVFMIAGKQSGKTVIGPVWLYRAICQLGPGDYLAISATYDLFKLKLLPALKQFFVHDLGIARYWAGDRIIELCDPYTGKFGARYGHEHELMWGRIILRSADSEEGLQSASALAAWMDEPGLYGSEVWKDVRGRLSLAGGPALGTTTPYARRPWLKTQVYDPWSQGLVDDVEVVQFASVLSPFFSDEEFASLQATMQKHEFEMDYGGQFGRPPAAIYEDFIDKLREEGGHKVRRFIIPSEWPRFVAIDPGVINPGKIWVAHDTHENIYYIYRAEKGGVRRTSKEHADYDVRRARDLGERVMWWAIGAKSEKYWREDYRAAGANDVREPIVADVWEGIDRGITLIKQGRLMVFEDLDDLIGEFFSYSREIKEGEPTNNIANKSTYHLIDSYRYFAVQVVAGRDEVRSGTGANKRI